MSYNKFIGVGRLVRDPETTFNENDKKIVTYTIAINEKYSKEIITTYVKCVVWGDGAEFAEKNLKKGIKVIVDGKLRINDYESKYGGKKKDVKILIERQEIEEAINEKNKER